MAKLSATAFVAQLAERCTRFTRSRVRFPVGGPGVAFFATSPRWVLKYKILTFENFLYQDFGIL